MAAARRRHPHGAGQAAPGAADRRELPHARDRPRRRRTREQHDPRPIEELRAWAANMMDRRAARAARTSSSACPPRSSATMSPLVLPAYSDLHDWELELAVVIGREAFRVDREHAHGARRRLHDRERHHDARPRLPQGHEGDRHRLVPRQERPGLPADRPVPRARAVRRRRATCTSSSTLNGETMQDATTADLLFDIPALIAGASQTMPLLPGDLLLTGSPAGNGIMHGRILRDGDVMIGAIEGLGAQAVRACRGGCAMSTSAAASEPGRRPSDPPSSTAPTPTGEIAARGRGVPQLGPLGRRRRARHAQLHRRRERVPDAASPRAPRARASRSRSRST